MRIQASRVQTQAYLSLLTVAILGLAALFKALNLPTVHHERNLSYFVTVGIIQLEVFMAAWHLLSRDALSLWRASFALFVVFSCVNAYQTLIGSATCGCFGAWTVSPLLMLLVDLSLLACYLLTWPREGETFPHGLAGVTAATLAFTASAAVTFSILPPGAERAAKSLSDALQRATGGLVLRPEDWVGRQFPLLDLIESSSELSLGEWDLLFAYQGCMECRAEMRRFCSGTSDGKILIDLDSSLSNRQLGCCRVVQLNGNHRWIINAPVVVHLSSGRVVSFARQPGRTSEN